MISTLEAFTLFLLVFKHKNLPVVLKGRIRRCVIVTENNSTWRRIWWEYYKGWGSNHVLIPLTWRSLFHQPVIAFVPHLPIAFSITSRGFQVKIINFGCEALSIRFPVFWAGHETIVRLILFSVLITIICKLYKVVVYSTSYDQSLIHESTDKAQGILIQSITWHSSDVDALTSWAVSSLKN